MSTFRTFTGKQLNLNQPLNGLDLDIEDIAHSLSLQCRYNGMTDRFYSVAEHSVRCAIQYGEFVEKRFKGLKPRSCRAMLMHDASEAYITDIPTPLKKIIGKPYYRLEAEIMETISKRFGFYEQWNDPTFQAAVKIVDEDLLLSELKTMFRLPVGEQWHKAIADAPLLEDMKWGVGWSPSVAKEAFLSYFHLTKEILSHADNTE